MTVQQFADLIFANIVDEMDNSADEPWSRQVDPTTYQATFRSEMIGTTLLVTHLPSGKKFEVKVEGKP